MGLWAFFVLNLLPSLHSSTQILTLEYWCLMVNVHFILFCVIPSHLFSLIKRQGIASLWLMHYPISRPNSCWAQRQPQKPWPCWLIRVATSPDLDLLVSAWALSPRVVLVTLRHFRTSEGSVWGPWVWGLFHETGHPFHVLIFFKAVMNYFWKVAIENMDFIFLKNV